MKDFMKLLAILLITVSATTAANAQSLKFGHVDLQGLIQVMPERASAEQEFNAFQADLEEILGEMQKDYQTKLAEFEQMDESVSEIKKNAKVAEIQDVQQRIQNYQVTAQQQLQQKNNEIMKPIYDKAKEAIAEVAKEQGLIYVFEVNSLIYNSNQSVDVLPLVKSKLGIQ